MFSIGDIVVQQRGADAGRTGCVTAVSRNGYVDVRDARGCMFRCQRGNLLSAIGMLKSASAFLASRSRTGTQLQFLDAMNEWTRIAQLCIGLGLHAEASVIWRQFFGIRRRK